MPYEEPDHPSVESDAGGFCAYCGQLLDPLGDIEVAP
jgi:hypothetical protein